MHRVALGLREVEHALAALGRVRSDDLDLVAEVGSSRAVARSITSPPPTSPLLAASAMPVTRPPEKRGDCE